MKNISNDNEGWYALCVSILCNITPEQAFRLLEKGTIHKGRKWSWQDIDDIQAYRDQGMYWKDIAEIFNITVSALHKNFHYWKRKKRRT